MTTARVFFSLAAAALCFPLLARAQDAPKPPPDMVLVPAGPFTMGTDRSEDTGPDTPRSDNDAQPQHVVTLPAFFIDKTEVTNAQYKKFCDATHYPPPPDWIGGTYPAGQDNTAVNFVNWWEASAYAAFVGKRLPTEPEWEKAARGADSRLYPWGDDWDESKVVWGEKEPQAVAQHPDGASPYGALDMAGNVFEWTTDWYRAYPDAPHNFPEYGTIYKVIRGGGFFGFESIARTYYRCVSRPQARSEWLGFRCAKDVTK